MQNLQKDNEFMLSFVCSALERIDCEKLEFKF